MTDRQKSHRAAKTTIVGGQPPGNDRELATVPVGLEELLGMAAVDPEFAAALLTDPAAAVAASGLDLTPTEQAILGALDQAALVPMIVRVGQTLPEPERRAFLEQAAAAVVVLVGGAAALAGCKGDGGSKLTKQKRRTRQPDWRDQADTGARPDRPHPRARPKARPDASVEMPKKPPKVTTGIRPRRPRSGRGLPMTGINPDRPPTLKDDDE